MTNGMDAALAKAQRDALRKGFVHTLWLRIFGTASQRARAKGSLSAAINGLAEAMADENGEPQEVAPSARERQYAPSYLPPPLLSVRGPLRGGVHSGEE